jgi:hypothetical protein
MTDPTPPVPPDELIDHCYKTWVRAVDARPARFYLAERFAAWGWEQAIPEREELAGLLMELGQEVEEEADALCSGENIHPETESHAGNLRELRDRARAAAARLRGGGSDG